jgi:3'-5' exonuclease
LAEPFSFTFGRWFNKLREDGDHAKAPLHKAGFTYDGFAYGQDYPQEFEPPPGTPVQRSLICSTSTFLLAVDVDYPEALPGSATGGLVSLADAVSTRGTHFHAIVDMRGVSEQDWPAQGRTAWGDVKAAGFIPVPGSVHKSGAPYQAAPGWQNRLVRATPELLTALRADREGHAMTRLGLSWPGARLPDGTYLYASGYAGGSYKVLPDGALAHDDELKDLVWDMHVEYGEDENTTRQAWDRLRHPISSDWAERDWLRHWHRVPEKRAQRLEEDDTLRLEEDFGLRRPATPLEAAIAGQQQDYEDRREQAAGFGPPTPPQPDGAYEGEHDGVSWFHYYLGYGTFDGGEPTDAGNALAVLKRAGNCLRLDEEAGTWLKRVAGRWVQDEDAAREAVTALGFLLPQERSANPLKDARYEHLDPEADAGQVAALKRHAANHARYSSSAAVSAIAAMMKNIARARPEPWMTVRDSQVDADPEVLWAGGVPWDLKASANGPVRAWHVDRGTPHLHGAACWPDASVPTPLWDELMREVWVRPDPANRGQVTSDPWLASWAVLVLSAGVTGYPKKAVPLLKGGTDTGKSTTVDAIASVLGTYFTPLNSKILDSGASTHDTVLMELKGARLTFLDEGIQRGKMATARLKRLVGGSSITGNRMRQDPVSFRPTHTLAVTLNPEENFSFDDPAVDSRMRLLPCNGEAARVIAVSKKFNYFQSPAWLKERPGVLARLMAAAAVLLNDAHAIDKDRAPASVVMAERAAKDEEDEVLRWFLEATEDCPEGYRSRPLYLEFKRWTEETKTDRGTVPSETRWGKRMNELIPEDHPDSPTALTTPENTKLRRRRPRQQVPGGFSQVPGGFGGSAGRPSAAALMESSSRYYPTTYDPGRAPWVSGSGPETGATPGANPPGNPPEEKDQVKLLAPVSPVSSVSTSQEDHQEEKDPLTHSLEKGTGETHRLTGPTGKPPGPGLAAGVQPEKRAGYGENGQNGENLVTPPTGKTPRTRLSEQEKAQRAHERKEKLARDRAEAKAAKVAELGGPLVQLPAIVLRDQRIAEVSADTCRTWLEGCLDALSVDVEHTGYPRTHKDYALRLVQLGNAGSSAVLDPSDPDQAAVIRWALANAKKLHAHSALADLIPLEAAGLCDATVWDKMTDTVLVSKLTDPSLCDSDEGGLKQLAKKLLGPEEALSWKCDELRKEVFAAGGWISDCEVTTPRERSGWAMIPLCRSFILYSASDVMDAASVARALG